MPKTRPPYAADQRQLFWPVGDGEIGGPLDGPGGVRDCPFFLREDGLVTDAQVRRLRGIVKVVDRE